MNITEFYRAYPYLFLMAWNLFLLLTQCLPETEGGHFIENAVGITY